jgi:hypothetical protein
MSDAQVDAAIIAGIAEGRRSAEANKAMDVMWPCGFAWIVVNIRKNHKHAKVLLRHGFSWSDYDKQYWFRGNTISHAQNMDYRERFLNDMSKVMRDMGVPAYVCTRID